MPYAAEIFPNVTYCQDAYQVADGAEALMIVTAWPEFRHLDLGRIRGSMARPVIVDGRNLFEPNRMAEAGFHYVSVGRQTVSQDAGRRTGTPKI
jgi:UDPglucose 6-dehydrogenase